MNNSKTNSPKEFEVVLAHLSVSELLLLKTDIEDVSLVPFLKQHLPTKILFALELQLVLMPTIHYFQISRLDYLIEN